MYDAGRPQLPDDIPAPLRRRRLVLLARREGWLAWVIADIVCIAGALTPMTSDVAGSLFSFPGASETDARLLLSAAYIVTLVMLRQGAIGLLTLLAMLPPFRGPEDAGRLPGSLGDDTPGESEPLQGLPESPELRRRARHAMVNLLSTTLVFVAIAWTVAPGLLIGASVPIYSGLRLFRMSQAMGFLGCRDVLHPAWIELGGRPRLTIPLDELRVVLTKPLTSVFQWVILERGRGSRTRFLHAEAVRLLVARVEATHEACGASQTPPTGAPAPTPQSAAPPPPSTAR